MTPDDAPQPLLDRHYVDVEDWGREVGWDASITQIESGPLRARAAAFGTTRCLATRGEFSRSIHQIGTPPTGMLSFGLPDDDVETFRWCGRDAVGGDILNFNLASGFEGTTPAGFAGFAISFSQDLLDEIIESHGFDGDVLEQIRRSSVWNNAGGDHVTRFKPKGPQGNENKNIQQCRRFQVKRRWLLILNMKSPYHPQQQPHGHDRHQTDDQPRDSDLPLVAEVGLEQPHPEVVVQHVFLA